MEDKILIKKLVNTMKKYGIDIAWIGLFFVTSTVLGLLIPVFTKEIMDRGFMEGNLKVLIGLTFLVFMIKVLDGIVSIIKEKKEFKLQSDSKGLESDCI